MIIIKNNILVLSLSLLFSQNDTTFIRDYYQYDLRDYGSIEIDLNFGLGELEIGSYHKSKTISGIIEYNPDHTEADVDFSSSGNKAFLSIKGESGDNGLNFNDFDLGDEFHNYMDFDLAKGIPTELVLDFGLGEANINLTDLSLSYFELDCGLSDVKLEMDRSNKITCERVSISSGLGDFNGYGLGNLNSRKFNLDVGLGVLELILPENVNIKLRVDHSFLSSVDVDGLMSEGRNKYVSKDWDKNRPTITGDISVGIGSVDIEVD